jgi:hypothetical protein
MISGRRVRAAAVRAEEGKKVEKRDANVLLSILAFGLVFAFALALRTEGGQSQRGECQQTCERQYQECRRGTNANQDACKATFDTCRAGCRDIRGNQNTNGNVNTNTNGNTNANGNMNTNGNTNANGNMNTNGNVNTNTNTNTNGNTNGNDNTGRGRGRLPGTPRGPVNRNLSF